VRNVPFEATRKELRELLSAFGELTSIRLPKKFDGKHRGFAFADFVTASISQKRKLNIYIVVLADKIGIYIVVLYRKCARALALRSGLDT
jgi:hypothetical protein